MNRGDFLRIMAAGLAGAGFSDSLLAASKSSASPAKTKVELGIDVLESMGFSPISGMRIGLLTHPAGVNRNGRSSIDVLRSARNKGVRLTALFGPEHGIYGNEKAEVPFLDKVDKRTGLPVYSLYGKYRKPTTQMLSKIDAMVVDLQDIGSRSYTYISCMLRTMEACFECGKQVVILDRPNPLGGTKVDGPPLDKKFKSYVGMFQVPYVHGLTIGELAKLAKGTTGAMEISDRARYRGDLKVIPMRGWQRSMLWSDTGLKWVPTSPAIPSIGAAMGYPMTGLGCQHGGFQHGYGTRYPFRLLTFAGKRPEQVWEALRRRNIRGLDYKITKTKTNSGKEIRGVYVLISNWNAWRPTELNFHLMQMACEFNGGNVFRGMKASNELLFNKHVGSQEWWDELHRRGQYAQVELFMKKWQAYCANFKKSSSRFRLYH